MKHILFFTILAISLTSCEKKITYQNQIHEDVSFLANDALEGRQTGTEGEQKAAEYLIERFKTMGLEPKGTEGYLQSFSFKPKTDPHKEVEFSTNDRRYHYRV